MARRVPPPDDVQQDLDRLLAMGREQYVELDGGQCPHCRSENVAWGKASQLPSSPRDGTLRLFGAHAATAKQCRACRAAWWELNEWGRVKGYWGLVTRER